MDEWAELLNLILISGEKLSWEADFVKDLNASNGLRHDTIVRIEKKANKIEASAAFKAACQAKFPMSEHFNPSD